MLSGKEGWSETVKFTEETGAEPYFDGLQTIGESKIARERVKSKEVTTLSTHIDRWQALLRQHLQNRLAPRSIERAISESDWNIQVVSLSTHPQKHSSFQRYSLLQKHLQHHLRSQELQQPPQTTRPSWIAFNSGSFSQNTLTPSLHYIRKQDQTQELCQHHLQSQHEQLAETLQEDTRGYGFQIQTAWRDENE